MNKYTHQKGGGDVFHHTVMVMKGFKDILQHLLPVSARVTSSQSGPLSVKILLPGNKTYKHNIILDLICDKIVNVHYFVMYLSYMTRFVCLIYNTI